MTKITPATGATPVAQNTATSGTNNTKEKIVVFVNQGGNSKPAKEKEFNLYGKDFENFSKFKGNDKHDAMRMTNAYAGDVKKAYLQLQHEFPEVHLEFDDMPDPKTCRKGREGFFTYQQYLSEWKDLSLKKIENEREKSTVEALEEEGAKTRFAVGAAAATVIANDDANTAIVLNEQEQNTDEVKEAIKKDGANTRATVKKESEANQAKTEEEGKKTRDAVFIDGAITRVQNEDEHARTREQVRQSAEDTQQVVKDEAEKTRENSNENAQQVENTVKKEGEKTRAKVQEGIEIDDPTGTKRAIYKTKKALRDNPATVMGGLLFGGPGAILGRKIDEDE